ncbi:MAG: DinB family protein [Bryobacteraceae bacterium]
MQSSAQEIGERLKDAVENTLPRLLAISEDDAKTRAGVGHGWSRKQELGHLIDSATNNRIRFVVAGLSGRYVGPTYDGDGWVDLGGYVHAPWIDLIELWERLNRSLALLIERIPEDRLTAPCKVGDDEEATLGFLMEDYVAHMETHLQHVL